jgi:hypothetical protein
MSESHRSRFSFRPYAALAVLSLLVVLMALLAWRGTRTGVWIVESAGGNCDWDATELAVWLESHLGISTDLWMSDGNVTGYADVDGIDDSVLLELRRFPELRGLELTWGSITNEGLRALVEAGGLRQLRSLKLDRCPQVTGEGIRSLNSLPTIEELCLFNIPVSGSDLAGFHNLTELQIRHAPLTNGDLATIAALPKLEGLSLAKTMIDDQGMAALASCPQLRGLRLDGCELTDAGAREIPRYCGDLETLGLACNNLTDDCLSLVDDLPRLKYLDITETNITAEAADRLRKRRPGLMIVDEIFGYLGPCSE